jgi:NADH dehydrogenase [ubiquinone] 1 alpha subcomplex assembly factor 1
MTACGSARMIGLYFRLDCIVYFYLQPNSISSVLRLAVVAACANIVITLLAPAPASATPTTVQTAPITHSLFSFTDGSVVAKWAATDDRVMGGVSRSRLRFDPMGHAVFEGVMSLEQNGGFASVRADSPPLPPLPSLEKLTHYVVEVRGDGKRYKLNLRTSGQFSRVSYQATFPTVANEWTTVAIPVSSFEPTFRGRRVVDAPPLNVALVDQVGLMISDQQDGTFQLAVRKIAVESR